MKKEHPIRTLLNLKQEDIAMLLGISRSHWGMYETGKRDLPLRSKELLADLLVYIHASKASAKQPQDSQQHLREQKLEHLLRENEYQQLLLARKMADTEKKQTGQIRLLLLVDFLNNTGAKSEKDNGFNHQGLLTKAKQTIAADFTTILLEQELKKEVLKFEKKLIESQLRKKNL